jgi:hypothetical protein
MLAWRIAQGTCVLSLLSVLLYQKPASFYVNFVMLPSLFAFLAGLIGVIVTIVLTIVALFKRVAVQRALTATGLAVLTMVLAFAVIYWRAH